MPYKNKKKKNDYLIRRAAIDFNVPLLTNKCLVFLKSFCEIKSLNMMEISSWRYN
uniref:hypothetical protein n=1 Tax=Candidatus Karelsulcia muelleri TaxID=336810 RepID=UPI00374CA432